MPGMLIHGVGRSDDLHTRNQSLSERPNASAQCVIEVSGGSNGLTPFNPGRFDAVAAWNVDVPCQTNAGQEQLTLALPRIELAEKLQNGEIAGVWTQDAT
jgi:hypothetical protein